MGYLPLSIDSPSNLERTFSAVLAKKDLYRANFGCLARRFRLK